MTLNFSDFQASRKAVADFKDLGYGNDTFGDFNEDKTYSGFVYDKGCYIENNHWAEVRKRYHLHIERMEWFDDDLAKLERILWAIHYLPDAGGDLVLSKNDGSLDAYIIGHCNAFGRDIDGDYFAQVFSGKDEWTWREASEVLNAYPAFLASLEA